MSESYRREFDILIKYIVIAIINKSRELASKHSFQYRKKNVGASHLSEN